jgi:hypothetical protein
LFGDLTHRDVVDRLLGCEELFDFTAEPIELILGGEHAFVSYPTDATET